MWQALFRNRYLQPGVLRDNSACLTSSLDQLRVNHCSCSPSAALPVCMLAKKNIASLPISEQLGTRCLECDLQVGWDLNVKPAQFDLAGTAVLHSMYVFSKKACLQTQPFQRTVSVVSCHLPRERSKIREKLPSTAGEHCC